MTEEEQSTDRTVWKTALSLALPVVLTLIGANLLRTTLSLPFEAGGPFVDLLVPIGAIVFGVAGFVTARRGRHQQDESQRSVRALFVVETVLASFVVVVGLLMLLLIFALCGTYWSQDSC